MVYFDFIMDGVNCVQFSQDVVDLLNSYCNQIVRFLLAVMMDEPRFSQPIPNVTVAVGRDANLPCVVEHLGTYKVRK